MNHLMLAIKVASHLPNRYRVARPATTGDETIAGQQVILSIPPEKWQSVFTVRSSLYGILETDVNEVSVFNGVLT